MVEFVIWIILIIGISYVFEEAGKVEGRLQVAKGEYECALKTQADQTTEWECIELPVRQTAENGEMK